MARGYHTDVVMGRLVDVGLYEFRIKWVCTNVAKNIVFDATNQWRDSKRGYQKKKKADKRKAHCDAVRSCWWAIYYNFKSESYDCNV